MKGIANKLQTWSIIIPEIWFPDMLMFCSVFTFVSCSGKTLKLLLDKSMLMRCCISPMASGSLVSVFPCKSSSTQKHTVHKSSIINVPVVFTASRCGVLSPQAVCLNLVIQLHYVFFKFQVNGTDALMDEHEAGLGDAGVLVRVKNSYCAFIIYFLGN